MKRTSLKGAECPVARSLDIIGDWWSLLIVRDAFDGMRRFGEFQKSLGISRGILASRLHELIARGILETTPASDESAYHDYLLTKKGKDLFPIIVSLRQWGEDHCFRPGEAHSVLVEKGTAQPVRRLEVRSKNGRALASSDTIVKKVGRRTPLLERAGHAPAGRRSPGNPRRRSRGRVLSFRG